MIDIKNIRIKDDFWSEKQRLIRDVVIPYQEKILNDEIEGAEKSHAIANFRIAAGVEKGDFYGMVFQDSDVAKWLEGVAYSLASFPDKELEKRADEVIDIIEKVQCEDGYLNTYFTIKEPEHRWQNLLECHELYCAGHMIEAAVAYYEATGKDKLLTIMMKFADYIDGYFGEGKTTGIPGHQEIELALVRLFETTGKDKYLKLAQYFIDERGINPQFFEEEAKKRDWSYFHADPKNTRYNQSHLPVREQKEAVGHSVRAVYMYTAMAALAKITHDESLLEACETLWDNMTGKRMYVTGGIGSTAEGEAFTVDYDLPNDTIYAETCASIGLVFFARRMLEIRPCNKYADVMERALYNGILSGMQMDGKRFFYVNPLEVNPGISGEFQIYKHVLPERPGWYACACCPPNVVRLLMSLASYAWDENDGIIFSHLFLGGTADLKKASITVESKYPWEGKVSYKVSPNTKEEEFTLSIRIPGYISNETVIVNGIKYEGEKKEGYIYIKREWREGDKIEICFDMPVRRVYANTEVRADSGKVCLMRGPLVYCFEGVDNGGLLQELRIPEQAEITSSEITEGILKGIRKLVFTGCRKVYHKGLYTEEKPAKEEARIVAIPYYTWGNRGKNQMCVWLLEE